MDEDQTAEYSTPECNESTHSDTVFQNDESPQMPPPTLYASNPYQSKNAYVQNKVPPQNTYYAPAPAQSAGLYQQQNNYQPNMYQPINTYQPQYPYPQNNYQPQYYYDSPARGKATAALVLGIISLVFFWMSFLAVISVICSIVGIILGNSARKVLTPQQGRGQATAGMVCSIIALVLAVLMLILFVGILLAIPTFDTLYAV